jgi:UDP-N-acetylmuramoylalanine--D-glutamate ligase
LPCFKQAASAEYASLVTGHAIYRLVDEVEVRAASGYHTQMKQAQDTRDPFEGIRILIVGLAREGTALARFLAERGARVTATDRKGAEDLVESLAYLKGLPVALALGGHPLELLDSAEVVFVSPGVPLEIPLLVEARRRSLPLSSETRLFTRICPAAVIGITGSSGKTTTTALVGEMLESAGCRTWVGGNIGRPLIGHLADIGANDLVVMELSSFQLEFFAPWPGDNSGQEKARGPGPLFDPQGWSPPIAAVLNVTPNHLDRHGTMESYMAAKTQILAHQQPGDVAVLNFDNPMTREMGQALDRQQKLLWFSSHQTVREGTFLRGDQLLLRLGSQEEAICRTGELKLLGQHNVENVLAACALAAVAGAPVAALRRTATTFTGVSHRLELVLERDGVRWYDDSIATSPERTVAALRAFPRDPLILLAGGRDKHLPWDEMADLTWRRARHLILFGEAASLIEGAMRRSGSTTCNSCYIHRAGTLEEAVAIAAELVQPGDVVLLSPGGTSFDAYRDFVERGEHFQRLVKTQE